MTTSTGEPALQVWTYYEYTAQGNSGAVVINGSQTGGTGCEAGRVAAGRRIGSHIR